MYSVGRVVDLFKLGNNENLEQPPKLQTFHDSSGHSEENNVIQELEPDEYEEFAVVGVSYQRENFAHARKILGARIGEDRHIRVLLRHNPENTKSPTRTAVGVYFEGMLLGHVPEVSSGMFVANVLTKAGGSVSCKARIWFGDGINSLRLHISWPPRLAGEERIFELTKVEGDGLYSIKLKTSSRKIDWKFIASTQAKLANRKVLKIGEVFLGDDGLISSGEFGRDPLFQSVYGEIASFYQRDVVRVQRRLNALGGQALVRYRVLRTGETTHTVELDWNLPPLEESRHSATGAAERGQLGETKSVAVANFPPLRWPNDENESSTSSRDRVRARSKNKVSKGAQVSSEEIWAGIGNVLAFVVKLYLFFFVGAFALLKALVGSPSNKRKKRR